MSLRMAARLLNRSLTTVWRAVDALGLKPDRVGMTCYLSWQEVEQLDLYLRQPRRRRRTHA